MDQAFLIRNITYVKYFLPEAVISEAGACLVIAGGNFEKSGGDLG